MQTIIKPLKVKYGPEATSILRNNNTLEEKPAPPEHGSTASLESSSSTSF